MADDDEDEPEDQFQQPAETGGSASEWDAFPVVQQQLPAVSRPVAFQSSDKGWDAFPLAQQPQQQRPVSDKGWDAFPLADKQPEAESGPMTALRTAAHNILPGAASVAAGVAT